MPMNNIDPNKNCHEYCPMGKCCRWLEGGKGVDPDECAMKYKLEDLAMEAHDILEEERKSRFEVGEDW